MWTYKSVAILATGKQPDYWFELALVFFGLSILLPIQAVRDQIDRFAPLATILAWVAALGGVAAGVAYIIDGDDGLFGPAALVTMISIIGTLFLIGGQVLRNRLLPRYCFAPRLLAWLFVASLPLGAVLSGIGRTTTRGRPDGHGRWLGDPGPWRASTPPPPSTHLFAVDCPHGLRCHYPRRVHRALRSLCPSASEYESHV